MIMTESKISLPAYKLAYAFCFVVILSLIRGITFSYEIGVAMEAPMAILAMVFCADTYTQEIHLQTVRDTPFISYEKTPFFHWDANGDTRDCPFCIKRCWLRYVL